MSLDELAKANKREGGGGRGRGRRNGGGGGKRRGEGEERPQGDRKRLGGGRGGAERRRGGSRGRRNPYSRAGEVDEADHWGHDMHDEHLRQPSPPRSEAGDYGQEVKISDLHYDVLSEDLEELFGTVAKVVSVKVDFDEAGRSDGTATAVFAREDEASRIVDTFNGRKIDDKAMTIKLGKSVHLNKPKPKQRERAEPAFRREERQDEGGLKVRGRGKRGGAMRSTPTKDELDDELSSIKIHVRV